jgi:hypothetical protein
MNHHKNELKYLICILQPSSTAEGNVARIVSTRMKHPTMCVLMQQPNETYSDCHIIIKIRTSDYQSHAA